MRGQKRMDMPRGRVIPAPTATESFSLGIQTRSLSKERYSSLIELARLVRG